MSNPATLNFVRTADNPCIKGVTFRTSLTCYDDADGTVPSDLTGLIGRVRIWDGETKIWEGTSPNGGVTITALSGTIAIEISATVTDTFAIKTYHIDIDLVDTAPNPDEVDRIAHGDFEVVR